MKARLFLLLLAGAAGGAWAQGMECEPMDATDQDCQGDRHYPIVTINTAAKTVDREFVCAARESVIEFRVVPQVVTKFGSVAIKSKVDSNTWLIGTNSANPTKIEVKVPAWLENDRDHGYNVVFEDGTCLDPRVHVED